MTRQEKRHQVVTNVVKRLRNDPESRASEYIQKILKDPQFKLWLDTWVIAPLEMSNQTDAKLAGDYLAQENFNAALSMSR